MFLYAKQMTSGCSGADSARPPSPGAIPNQRASFSTPTINRVPRHAHARHAVFIRLSRPRRIVYGPQNGGLPRGLTLGQQPIARHTRTGARKLGKDQPAPGKSILQDSAS